MARTLNQPVFASAPVAALRSALPSAANERVDETLGRVEGLRKKLAELARNLSAQSDYGDYHKKISGFVVASEQGRAELVARAQSAADRALAGAGLAGLRADIAALLPVTAARFSAQLGAVLGETAESMLDLADVPNNVRYKLAKTFSHDSVPESLEKIPPYATSVVFAHSYRKADQFAVLASVLARLPPRVREITFDGSIVHGATDACRQALAAIPGSVVSVGFHDNGSFQSGPVGTPDVFAADLAASLPKHVIHVDLAGNMIDVSGASLLNVAASLPSDVRSLNLADSRLCELGSDGLRAVVAALPRGLKSLRLPANRLDKLGARALRDAVENLPPGLRVLDLSGNNLLKLGMPGLSDVLSKLPPAARFVDLSNNGLPESFRQGISRATPGVRFSF